MYRFDSPGAVGNLRDRACARLCGEEAPGRRQQRTRCQRWAMTRGKGPMTILLFALRVVVVMRCFFYGVRRRFSFSITGNTCSGMRWKEHMFVAWCQPSRASCFATERGWSEAMPHGIFGLVFPLVFDVYILQWKFYTAMLKHSS